MKKFALLFPGQGSQYPGMGKELYDNYAVVRETFEEASDALGFDMKKLCFESSEQELKKTENCQPAILTASVATYRVFNEEFNLIPFYAAGHSLGEYSALVCSGAINFSDGVRLVRSRGKFMQETTNGNGYMVAINGVYNDLVVDECEKVSHENGIAVVSAYNSPQQTTVSGDRQAVELVMERLNKIGANAVPLKVTAPFHSPLMAAAATKLKDELKKYRYNSIKKFPVISNVTGRPYLNEDCIIDNLTMQMTEPVNWLSTMKYLEDSGVLAYIEIGPRNVLKNIVKRSIQHVDAYTYDDIKDRNSIKMDFCSNEKKIRFISKCMAIAVCTQNLNWDEQEYEEGVIKPYKKVKEMYESLEAEGKDPSGTQINQAIDMLRSVFKTKKVPIFEQEERYKELFNETGVGYIFPEFEKFK